MAGIRKTIGSNQARNQNEITSAFQDLNSLKAKSKDMVEIARTIKEKNPFDAKKTTLFYIKKF